MRLPALLALGLLACGAARAELFESHGYAQFGVLKYPARFSHFDWANPDAPKGGTLRIMALGSFDTLNPYTFKGTSPTATANFLQYGVSELAEPLMIGSGAYDPSGDEPASSYGLLARSVEYADDRSWVVFNLRPEARFNDGSAVTSEDVAFSYRTLLNQGHPLYRTALQEVERVDILDPTRIRFVLKRRDNPLLILRLGELPVLPEHYWKNRNFEATTFEPPLTSGPYRITQVVPGRRLVFERVRHWWGKALPANRGKYNFDRIEVEFYRDKDVAFEAFKAGEFDIYLESQAKNWAGGYDFPAARLGEVIKAQIPHQLPSQTQGLFFNTRRTAFADPRTRQALGLLFDFEWTNRALFSGAYQRANSYYPNSEFAARGLPSGQEWLLLAALRDQLPAAVFTQPFSLPVGDGNGIGRETLRLAMGLLASAGWRYRDDHWVNAQGQPLALEILLVNPSLERILLPYVENLRRVGVDARLRSVDRAQYKQRLDHYDFDMILMTLNQTLSPGLEQWQYFHSSQANLTGGKNYAGIHDPAVDALLDQLQGARSRDEQVAAARALDRVLLWQHYMVPNWYLDAHRVAYRNHFAFLPTPPYTLALNTWWQRPSETDR